jgi:hypothetical protein
MTRFDEVVDRRSKKNNMVCLRNIRFKGKEDNSGLGIKAKIKEYVVSAKTECSK